MSGGTFDPELDGERIAKLIPRVRTVMRKNAGKWLTLADVLAELRRLFPSGRFADNSVQTQIRTLRKEEWDFLNIPSRRRGGKGGLWEWCLLPGKWPGAERTPLKTKYKNAQKVILELRKKSKRCTCGAMK